MNKPYESEFRDDPFPLLPFKRTSRKSIFTPAIHAKRNEMPNSMIPPAPSSAAGIPPGPPCAPRAPDIADFLVRRKRPDARAGIRTGSSRCPVPENA